jgi:hypothetical protein
MRAHPAGGDVLGGLRLFCFLSTSSFSRMLLESVCSMVCDMVGDGSLWSRGKGVVALSQLVFPKRSSAVAALPPACRVSPVGSWRWLCHGGGSCIGVLQCLANAYYSAQNGTRSLIRSERKDRATSIYIHVREGCRFTVL